MDNIRKGRFVGKSPALGALYGGQQIPRPTLIGVDLASKPDKVSFCVLEPDGIVMHIDRDKFNALDVHDKDDLEYLTKALRALMSRHKATVEVANWGLVSPYRTIRFILNGICAEVSIRRRSSCITWANSEYPSTGILSTFREEVNDVSARKYAFIALSRPADWWALAMVLDAGLCLAARGAALEPAPVRD